MIGRARKRGIWIAAVFHDAIPVIHPELVRREARKFHSAYMSGLSELDLIIAVSETAAEQFREFAEERSGHIPPISICPSAGELVGEKQAAPKANTPRDTINILCVSTLEPRKNHKTLLQAFELASSVVSHPQLSLHLVGTRYKDADHVLELVNKAVSRCPNIIWHGKVTDQQLAQLYRDCDFTIYPSVIEGFGLAISQSLWNRRPCICANFGAMAEIADEGGCLTLDVRNTIELRDAIIALATDPDLRHRLVQEIESRPAKTWRAYADEICGLLQPVDRPNALQLT
jgi:glycosyltransferase involved in cell wall biosynthesis